MAEVAEAVEAVAPDYEVIDDRNSPYPLDMLSLVADNAWNEGIVLGDWRTTWPDLASVRGVVELNGEVIDEGHGRDVLGHPFEPLRWLANHLSSRGETLHAGEIVSTGSLVTTRFPKAGEQYRFTVEGVGSVEIGFRPKQSAHRQAAPLRRGGKDARKRKLTRLLEPSPQPSPARGEGDFLRAAGRRHRPGCSVDVDAAFGSLPGAGSGAGASLASDRALFDRSEPRSQPSTVPNLSVLAASLCGIAIAFPWRPSR